MHISIIILPAGSQMISAIWVISQRKQRNTTTAVEKGKKTIKKNFLSYSKQTFAV